MILASASPRRRELLSNAGVAFEVAPANVDESLNGEPAPEDAARELALRKAVRALELARASAPSPDAWILAADTVVGLPPVAPGGAWRLLGKAADDAEAREMLQALSGSEHQVCTGVAVVRARANEPNGDMRVTVETTMVRMRAIEPAEIEAYVASGEWRDKAGAYAIQETADRFVIDLSGGGFDNVVGLPVARTLRLLRSMGWGGDAVAGELDGS